MAIGLAADRIGNLYVSGDTAEPQADAAAKTSDLSLSKLDPDGKVLWTRQFGAPGRPDSGRRVLVDQEMNIYLAGWTGGDVGAPQKGQGDAVIIKVSPDGEILWRRQFGTELWDGIHGIVLSGDQKSILVGGCQHWPQCQAFLRGFDLQGNELWRKEITASHAVCGTQIAVDSEGNLYQTGGTHGALYGAYSDPSGASNDIFLAKIALKRVSTTP